MYCVNILLILLYTCSILQHTSGLAIQDLCVSKPGKFLLACDAENVHIWKFAAQGAHATHTLRHKSKGARCAAVAPAHALAEDQWCCAWGCADGRVHLLNLETTQHVLFIPPHAATQGGAKGGGAQGGVRAKAAAVSALCFAGSRLVLFGDVKGTLALVDFEDAAGPQVLVSTSVHNGKR